MNKTLEDTIENIFEEFDPVNKPQKDKEDRKPVTIWLPVEYKTKFDFLQDESKKEFGKVVQKILMAVINKGESKIGAQNQIPRGA